MKVLLSAYACEPGRGSESGVGWSWGIELAKLGYDVWVITRSNNKPTIDNFYNNTTRPLNLRFIYYDLPIWARWWKKGERGVHLYYLLWQFGAWRVAKVEHRTIQFDLVHHVTFVSVRQPSFMGNLEVPFILGPIGGGETAPIRLRIGYSIRGWLIDGLRDLANFAVKLDPLMIYTFQKASIIYVTSLQSKKVVPRRFHPKTFIQLAVGSNEDAFSTERRPIEKIPLRILYVGRFLHWKGMHLGIEAFAHFIQQAPDSKLTIAGKGVERKRWQAIVDMYDINNHIEWVPWVSQDDLKDLYCKSDVLLYPSLHDSGGLTVLEAMSQGMSIVCLDLGGPGAMVNDTCGVVIESKGMRKEEVVHGIADALSKLNNDRELLAQLKNGAYLQSNAFAWDHVVKRIYANAANIAQQ